MSLHSQVNLYLGQLSKSKKKEINISEKNYYCPTNKVTINIYAIISRSGLKIFKIPESTTGLKLKILFKEFDLINILYNKLSSEDDNSTFYFLQDNWAGHNQIKPIIESKFTLIDHPAYSPDLNPIEKIFSIIKHSLSSKLENRLVVTEDQLWELVSETAKNISLQTIHSLIKSMPKRLAKVIEQSGNVIKY